MKSFTRLKICNKIFINVHVEMLRFLSKIIIVLMVLN